MSVQGRAPMRHYRLKAIPPKWEQQVASQVAGLMSKLGATEEDNGVTVGELRNKLYKTDYGTDKAKKIQIGLARLESMGGVKEYGNGNYYLTKSASELKGELQHPYQGLLKRVFGSIFVLFGLGVVVLSGLSATGNAVLSRISFPDMGLVLSFILGIIGLSLLIKR